MGYFVNDTFFKWNNSNNQIEEEIKLLTFNSHNFSGFHSVDSPNVSKEIVAFVNKENPDIVCFQEFKRNMYSQFVNYPYKYQTPNLMKNSTQAIFSKYPIISSGSLDFKNTSNNVIYSDILIKNDTIRLYNVHLESFKVRPGSFKREVPTSIFNRMNLSFQKQLEQAKLVKEHSLKINYKKVICGDFNSTQFSSVYETIKGEMKDSYLEEGIGFGNTYYFKFLPFRIDFILTDLNIKSHKNFDVKLSDHKPIMASFKLTD